MFIWTLLENQEDYRSQEYGWIITIKIEISVELWLIMSGFLLPVPRPCHIASLLNPTLKKPGYWSGPVMSSLLITC